MDNKLCWLFMKMLMLKKKTVQHCANIYTLDWTPKTVLSNWTVCSPIVNKISDQWASWRVGVARVGWEAWSLFLARVGWEVETWLTARQPGLLLSPPLPGDFATLCLTFLAFSFVRMQNHIGCNLHLKTTCVPPLPGDFYYIL